MKKMILITCFIINLKVGYEIKIIGDVTKEIFDKIFKELITDDMMKIMVNVSLEYDEQKLHTAIYKGDGDRK